ncbi:hypothetical protein ONS95_002656 [Cadophora gregata]|uniref:uncharacterized protein n=1 Tax=Cadophora gregata TaxID=51156 RepID=UPI0026DADA42|nr:uncharacterized protein ONS95_002656 [Cadophora gregata]KAK0109992.1 hypothetical protein ONS95_002656 [Cadophora gregata]
MTVLLPLFLFALAAKVHAVTIKLYGATVVGQGDCNNNNVILTCTDIAEGDCCYIPNTIFGSAKFLALPLPAAQGLVFNDLNLYGCNGRATSVGYGLDLCLGPGTGAQWINPVKQTGDCAKTDDPLVGVCKLRGTNAPSLDCDYGSCLDNSEASNPLGECDYDGSKDEFTDVNCPSADRKMIRGERARL